MQSNTRVRQLLELDFAMPFLTLFQQTNHPKSLCVKLIPFGEYYQILVPFLLNLRRSIFSYFSSVVLVLWDRRIMICLWEITLKHLRVGLLLQQIHGRR